jgi:hypothetical protein
MPRAGNSARVVRAPAPGRWASVQETGHVPDRIRLTFDGRDDYLGRLPRYLSDGRRPSRESLRTPEKQRLQVLEFLQLLQARVCYLGARQA